MSTKLTNKQSQFCIKPVCAAVLLAFTVQTTQANPIGPSVVNGQASFATAGSTLTVTNTPGAIINWQGFSIGANEITRFAQQSASSAVLNRVISNNPSSILGSLQSNGRVFLVNPNGIVFGRGATIDVAGMVASTLNLSNTDFLAGRYNFTQVPGAQNISNAGSLTAQGNGQSGGQIYLIAPNVENTGIITAPNGEILLAAGHSVELVNSSNPNLRVSITAPAGDVTNVGQLVVSSGSLGLFGTVVRNSGQVSADSATLQGGKIVFKASQRVEAGGTVSAQGAGGGEIKLLADMQAGTVNVGGTLDASAPNRGDGGYIETSAHNVLLNNPTVTATAPYGKGGTWLIDPTDVFMDATYNGSVVASLNAGTNVTVATAAAGAQPGDITVAANIAKTAGANATLTLQAHNNIIVNSGVTISSTVGALDVVLNANSDGLNGGGIYLDTGSSIVSNGGNIVMGGGAVPSTGYAIGNGTITGGKTFNSGIYVLGNITAGAGNVTMHGEGIAVLPNKNFADGITFAGGTLSSNGIVTIDGIAHGYSNGTGDPNNQFGSGVDFFNAGTRLTTQTGTVTVTGLNDAPNADPTYYRAQGITVETGTIVETTGAGTLTFNGTANSFNTSWGLGVLGGTIRTTAAGGGAITLNGTNASGLMDGGVVILGGSVLSNGGEIRMVGAGLGGSVGIVSGSTIGGASSGNILIKANDAGPIDLASGSSINAGTSVLTLSLAGGTANDNGNSINAGALRLLGTGTFSLGGANNNVGTLAANVTGIVAYNDTNGFAIGSVTSFDGTSVTNTSGVTTNNGDFTGWAVGNIALNAGSAINTGTGAISLTATGGSLNISGNISAGTFSLNDGTWNQVSATLPGITVNDFQILGGTFIRALGGDGSVGAPYQLADIYGVQGMGSTGMLGKAYVLANNIDATGTVNWNAGNGFMPVGNAATAFTGSFNGQNLTISNLAINRPAPYVGLFGYTNGAIISNVGLVGGSVAGGYIVGGLVGWNGGTITGSYYTGSVSTAFCDCFSSDIGGLVGNNSGTISSSYANSNVTATGYSNIGGLVGNNNVSGTISNSYSSGGTVSGYQSVGGLVGDNSGAISNSYSSGGSVSGTFDFGGLVGANWNTVNTSYSTNAVAAGGGGLIGWDEMGYINNSYWDIQTSGRATSSGPEAGLTTAQMMTMASFTGWNIASTGGAGTIWRIYEGSTDPLLTSFLKPLAVTANAATKTYDGLAYSGGNGVTYSIASPVLFGTLGYVGTSQGAINTGSYAITPSGLYSDQKGYDISYVDGALTINPAPAPTPTTLSFLPDLVNTMLIPGNGAIGSSQSTISVEEKKKEPPPVVVVDGEILPAGGNLRALPVCPL